MFAGLSAFPLTPMDERGIDETALVGLVARLAQAGADPIGALGSTGNYAYLRREERSRVARLAVEAADGTPVMVSLSPASGAAAPAFEAALARTSSARVQARLLAA
jgi:4-hydroxy-tetrahydrodipicolinate synthase